MSNIDRTPVEQTFVSISVSVPNTIVPMATQYQLPSLIQSMLICNPSSNGNSVFFGDQNVTTTSGIEVIAGTAINLAIVQERQLYEIQDPALLQAQMIGCATITPVSIPIVVWNPSDFYFIAGVAGPTVIAVMLFRNVYI